MKNYINFQIGRYNRIQKMSFPQIASKLRQKLEEVFSLRINIRRLAFLLDKLSISFYEDNYQERPEVGAVNGEFYWVLRCFFDQVDLYTIPDLKKQINNLQLNNTYIPQVSGCGILTKEHILIARCQRPSRLLSNGVSASKYKHGDL
jgi:hypothetical protein